jgi:hypothetical protein
MHGTATLRYVKHRVIMPYRTNMGRDIQNFKNVNH